jgi:hypothetical protein
VLVLVSETGLPRLPEEGGTGIQKGNSLKYDDKFNGDCTGKSLSRGDKPVAAVLSRVRMGYCPVISRWTCTEEDEDNLHT